MKEDRQAGIRAGWKEARKEERKELEGRKCKEGRTKRMDK